MSYEYTTYEVPTPGKDLAHDMANTIQKHEDSEARITHLMEYPNDIAGTVCMSRADLEYDDEWHDEDESFDEYTERIDSREKDIVERVNIFSPDASWWNIYYCASSILMDEDNDEYNIFLNDKSDDLTVSITNEQIVKHQSEVEGSFSLRDNVSEDKYREDIAHNVHANDIRERIWQAGLDEDKYRLNELALALRALHYQHKVKVHNLEPVDAIDEAEDFLDDTLESYSLVYHKGDDMNGFYY